MKISVQRFRKPSFLHEGLGGDVRALPSPESVTLPLSIPGELPMDPMVELWDEVQVGQPIAKREDFVKIRSPISGEVSAIGPGYSPEGKEILRITIRSKGEKEPVPKKETLDIDASDPAEVLENLADLGFMPWRVIKVREQREIIRQVIVFAVDEEPPLAVQRRFIREFTEDLSGGIQALRKMFSHAALVVVVPEDMHEEAAQRLQKVDLFPTGNSVEDTNRSLLVHRITGGLLPPQEDPIEHGLLFLSAEEVAAMGRSLRTGEPRLDKLVTVSGPGLEQPVTVKIPLGTHVGEVLKALDIPVKSGDRVVCGGPLTGVAQPNLEMPVIEDVDGVLVIPREMVVPFEEAPCINCGRCVAVCPVNIPVNLAGRFSEFGFFDRAVNIGATCCVECGLCAYVCPSHRPLLQYLKFAKHEHEAAEKNRIAQEEQQVLEAEEQEEA